MTQLAFLLQWSGMPAAFNGILMTTCATFMEHLARFGNIRLLMLMALMTRLYSYIFRLLLVVTGRTLSNTQTSVFLMGKRHDTKLRLELDNFLVIRNSQLA